MSTLINSHTPTHSYPSFGSGNHSAPVDSAVSTPPQTNPDEHENLPITTASRHQGGQLVQARIGQPSVRHTRSPASEATARRVGGKLKKPSFPEPVDAKGADKDLQTTLTHSLINVLPFYDPIPQNASIRPFIDAFSEAVLDPKVQAWFKSKNLDLSTVRVLSDRVEGLVDAHGKKEHRTFTRVDGSGWREVSEKLRVAVRSLSTDPNGIFLPDPKRGFIDANIIFGFYGVIAPFHPKDRQPLGNMLEKEGWPEISDDQRLTWKKQHKQLVRENSDIDMRSQVVSELQELVKNKKDGDPLNLKDRLLVVKPSVSLARKSRGPRELFVKWLAMPAFKAFIEKIGLGGADKLYRIHDGVLEQRDAANRWSSLQGFLADEINKVGIGGKPEEKEAINAFSNQFKQLVEASKATGDVLYSQPFYDTRQFLAFSKLELPNTVAQVNLAIEKLSNASYGEGEISSVADRTLQLFIDRTALQIASDTQVELHPNTTIYPLFNAYRSALNTDEMRDWFSKNDMELPTVVVKRDSVSGRVTRDGVSSVQTFNINDSSGWRQVSKRLRAAARALDPERAGLPSVGVSGNSFSRNAVLRWYGITPPASDGNVKSVHNDLVKVDWATRSSIGKSGLERRVDTARDAIDILDERANLAKKLTPLLADKADQEAVSLAGLEIKVSSRSKLALKGFTTVTVADALRHHGMPLPTTVGELRNIIRWLDTQLEPPSPWGSYSGLLTDKWAPGFMSATDKTFLAGLSDEDVNRKTSDNILRDLDLEGVLVGATPETLRDKSDHFLQLLLGSSAASEFGERLARKRQFLGASGTAQLSSKERAQWLIAAIKLQIDPAAPGRPGTVAGYELYKPGDSGKTVNEMRADFEQHLKKNPRVDSKTAPLMAHLFLASAAPEFLIRGTPPTLRIGSSEWSDLRLGVVIAERLGGAGSSRGMNYKDIIALSRLEGRTPEEHALFTSYGADILLDWGMMQGLYAKPVDGTYTAQHFQQAQEGFKAEREQLIHALDVFNLPLPTREKLAIENLQKVFPDYSVEQLKTFRVHIADPNVRRNMKPSEPRTRSLVETYMSGDLSRNRWMLLGPDEQAPRLQTPKTPYGGSARLSDRDQAKVNQNVQALNGKIASLPDLKTLVPREVDAYLDGLKQGLGTTTRLMIANLPLSDRQALEFGSVELFALREQVDGVPKVEHTAGQLEERRGRKGTVIRSVYKGLVSYYEVFPDKMHIIKRTDLPKDLTLGGSPQAHPKSYGVWAPTVTQLENGAVQAFDFNAYSSNEMPRSGVSSPGIIIERLGDTLEAPPTAGRARDDIVPNSFSSARTQSIVDRIMQGNFIHHRDSVLKLAIGQLQLEEQRLILQENDNILLGMIPFVGAITDIANGNIIEGTRGLFFDTLGALVGGAGSSIKPLIKASKAVVPFGAKVFNVLEKGVLVVSSLLNPLDGAADMLVAAGRGVIAIPTLANNITKLPAGAMLGALEEKARAGLSLRSLRTPRKVLKRKPGEQEQSPETFSGKVDSKPVEAVKVGETWYATNPNNRLPIGTPLEKFEPSSTTTA